MPLKGLVKLQLVGDSHKRLYSPIWPDKHPMWDSTLTHTTIFIQSNPYNLEYQYYLGYPNGIKARWPFITTWESASHICIIPQKN